MQVLLPDHKYKQNELNEFGFCKCGLSKEVHDPTMTHVSKVDELVGSFAVEWLNRGLEHNPAGRSAFVKEFLHTHHAELDAAMEVMKKLETYTIDAMPIVDKENIAFNKGLTTAQSLLRNT